MKQCIHCKDEVIWNSPVHYFNHTNDFLHAKCFESFARAYPTLYNVLMEVHDIDRSNMGPATKYIVGVLSDKLGLDSNKG